MHMHNFELIWNLQLIKCSLTELVLVIDMLGIY